MKQFQKLGYMAIGAMLTLIISITAPVLAASIQKQINVIYNDIKIYIDGELITPKDANGKVVDPYISDGTTYLPVRAVGDAFGKTVEWDGATQSIYIGQKPGSVQYMTDICPAYEKSGDRDYTEYSAIESGGAKSFNISGNKYLNGFTFNTYAWAVYNLNSQYTSFEATFGHVDGTNVGFGENAGIRIYCDGVLKEDLKVSGDMYTIKVSLDLRGVNQLKFITVYADENWGPSFNGLYGFADPILR